MNACRPAALLFLRSLILAVAWGGAVVSGLLGDVALGQSTPTGFSLIPGGSFTMGRTSGDTDADAPSITVTVSPFYIQQTETTKAQWDEVRTWAVSNGYTDLAAGAGKAANHPVQSVSWWDVVKWCNARSEKEGLTPVYTVSGAVMRTGTTGPVANWSANGYRLPTEAEWEKAARGGVSGKRFPWGTDTISHAEANFLNNGGEAYSTATTGYHPAYATGGSPYTSPVARFAANGHGIYDMSGNVWEWCWDWFGSGSYSTSNGTTDPRGNPSGTYRVHRGGSWDFYGFYSRCGARGLNVPGAADDSLGFRPARTHVIENMSYIPGGSFTMGRTSGDTDADAPPITVTVSPFYMQQTETTKAQWDDVRTWAVNNGYTDLAAGAGKASNHPVQTVSWWDVVKWCNARSEKEGLTPVYTVSGAVMRTGTTEPAANWSANGYRLPTEAEWEKAARGGVSGKRFPWGTDTIIHAQANFRNNGGETYATGAAGYHPNYAGGQPYTSPVGSFGANGYGLYDMSGNVWEWGWDWYGASYYATSGETTDPRGPEAGTIRVNRGGGWLDFAFYARCSNRGNGGTPGYADGNYGFRPVRNIVPIIDSHPLPLTVSRDDSATFSVAATGNGTLTYQWQKDGVDIPGATSSSFSLAAAQPWHIGDYRVKVTDSVGTVMSETATLSLTGVSSEIWKGLVAYYPFDGTSADKSLSEFHGTAINAELDIDRFGRSANSYFFGTSTSKVSIPSLLNLSSGSFSISFWSFRNGPDSASAKIAFDQGTLAASHRRILVVFRSSDDAFWPPRSLDMSFWATELHTPANSSNLNAWEHWLVVYNQTDSTRTIFKNGNQLATMASGAPTTGPGATIGNSNDENLSFDGRLDDFRIYNRALSATEVQALYVSESSLPPTLSSPSSTQITATSATLGGNVTSDGGASITEHGVVYSATATTSDPIIDGTGVTKVTATGTTGVFTALVTGLTPSTNYSYKAYATNSQGTAYTSVATFTTPSTNGDLSALTLSSGTLSPNFDNSTTAYTASVPNATTSITVTPTRAQANATIEVRVNTGTYAAVTTGSASDALSLNVGTNTVDVRVTAQDGTTQKTYTVTVTRMATQSITFANPGAQLANATVNLSATGGGSGNPVTFTVEGPAALGLGNVLSFTGAGSVTVRANQAGNGLYHPAAEVSQTFTVSKATATVTLGNLAQTYDGTPRPVSATTNPSGKTVVLTYDDSPTPPTEAGFYIVAGTINDPIYQGSASRILVIAKAAQTITFAAIPDKLTTDTITLAATGGGSGNAVTYAVTSGPASITEGVLSFTGAGNVTITASQAGNANYDAASNVSRTFTVTKATATVALGNLSQTYDGTPKSATATTDPTGKTVTFTYEGSATAPTNAGSYAVVGTINDPIYQGSATGTLQIAKAAQTITFAAIPDKLTTDTITLSATGGESGNPVTFAVTEGPATISGGVLSFTGAGSVTITANQTGNANYEAASPVSRTFTVTKATATVTLANLLQTYDGTPKSATATTNPMGKMVTFTYAGSATAPTNAGTYSVVGTIDDAIYQGNASGTLEIAKAAQLITFAAIPDKLTTDTVNLSATGGGSGNAVTYAVTSGPASITDGVMSFSGSGSVTITASQVGNTNYEAATPVSRTFTVTKAAATVTLGSLSQTYDGTPKSSTATTNPAGKVVIFTYDGIATAPTNAGSYEVVGTIDDPIYQGNASGSLEIAKATQTITFAAIPNKLTTDTITLSATGGGSGNAVTYAVTNGPASITDGVLSFTGAGSVTIAASQAGNANYEAATPVSRTFTVTKASATVTLGNLSQTYDGTPKAATATTDPAGKTVNLTYGGAATAPTNAGSYEVVGTINDPIYQGSATGTLQIAKAAQTITFAAIPDKLTTDTITLSATGGGSGNPVTFAVTEGPATISGGVLSFTGSGNVIVTASQTGNANYDAASTVSRTFTVTKATATVTLGNLSQTYDGTSKSAAATTDPAGKTVTFTYAGSATAPTNAGTYAVVGTINDAIYQGNASGTLEIAKATQAITFAAIPDKLTTDTVTLSATGGGSGNSVTFAVTEGSATITDGVLSFTGAGNVTVTASQTGNANYDAASPVSRTLTVTKASATVTLANLSQTFDGTPKSASATTEPTGKTVTFTYDGSATAPTNAGSYEVVGTIDDGIYQGSANGTLTIAKAAQTITFSNPGPQLANATVNLSATGGGSGNEITFAVASGPASISNGVLSFTGPGNVTITASQAGNANYEAASPVSRTFTVSKAAATVTLSRLHQVADGTAREIVVTTVPADLEIAVTYNGAANAPVAPGSYAVVATSADDRYEGSASGTFVVDDPARSVRVPGGSLSALGDLTVPTFSIGAYEVTGSQWATIVTWAEANAGYDFDGAGAAASGDRPVAGISWFDAAKWCNARTEWENALLGRSLAPAYRVAGAVYKSGTPASPANVICDFSAGGYRLPTAAEWEYAARGGAFGTPATYPGGDTLDDLGWYTANSNGATQPAGGKTANGLGLYDLAGNAAEWTWDAPFGSSAQRLLRGGAWSSAASACEFSNFFSEAASARLDRSGFRIVRSISLALAAALDAPGLAWESGGDEAWSAQTTPSHDGIDSAESGPVAPGQSSWLETTVTGPANLRFRWEASQRGALDLFRLETRTGDPILLTGAANWSERLVELPEGNHTLRWVFVRDAASTGTSRVRLDAVSVTPATDPTVTTTAASSISGSGATLGGNVTADGGRTVTARGVVYSTTPEPTLTSPGVSTAAASGGTGTFSVVPAGLDEGTTYHARAYATNNLGTSYGGNVVFTTETAVGLTEGKGTVTGRSLLAGDTQRFRFGLAFPSDAALATTGLAAATWELRDGNGALIDSGSGNVDFGGLLLSGQYLLTVTSTGGTTQTFSLDLDASLEAVPKPDLSIGSDPTAATGVGVYPPTAQSVAALSRRGDPVTFFAKLANEGLLPDAMKMRGSGGNSLFAVSYTTAEGNVTAAMIAGTFATEVMGTDDAAVGMTVTITPNKRLLTKKVKKGKRVLTTYLRKTHSGLIEATATDDPTRSDTVRYQVTTTP